MNQEPKKYNWLVTLLRKMLGIDDEVTSAVEAERDEVLTAAETLMPDFAKIRDEKAKAGATEYKDGRDMVRTGERKMDDGAEAVKLARVLGSRVKQPK